MVQDFHLPPTGFGPGSQPQDDTLEYMPLPQDMRTYAPHIPEAEVSDPDALDLLGRVAAAARAGARRALICGGWAAPGGHWWRRFWGRARSRSGCAGSPRSQYRKACLPASGC